VQQQIIKLLKHDRPELGDWITSDPLLLLDRN
jgi:hypothetical protein